MATNGTSSSSTGPAPIPVVSSPIVELVPDVPDDQLQLPTVSPPTVNAVGPSPSMEMAGASRPALSEATPSGGTPMQLSLPGTPFQQKRDRDVAQVYGPRKRGASLTPRSGRRGDPLEV